MNSKLPAWLSEKAFFLMPIPKPLSLAGMWVTQKDLDKITWMWRAKCVINVNKERQRLRVLFVFDLIEGF